MSTTTLCKLTVMNEQTKNATSRKQSNTTAYNSTAEEKGVPPKPIFVISDVLKKLCPGDCSENGRCKNFKCICNFSVSFTPPISVNMSD